MKSSKPEDSSLQWCEKFGVPYWKLNLLLIWIEDGWWCFQSKKDMDFLIPHIDNKMEKVFEEQKDALQEWLRRTSSDS